MCVCFTFLSIEQASPRFWGRISRHHKKKCYNKCNETVFCNVEAGHSLNNSPFDSRQENVWDCICIILAAWLSCPRIHCNQEKGWRKISSLKPNICAFENRHSGPQKEMSSEPTIGVFRIVNSLASLGNVFQSEVASWSFQDPFGIFCRPQITPAFRWFQIRTWESFPP